MPEPFLPGEPVRAAYVHIPFCISKCSYCDFCSFPGLPEETMAAYAVALEQEIIATARHASRQNIIAPLRTVFFGGGTPTVLPTEMLTKLFKTLRRSFGLEKDGEFTLEANPGTVTKTSLEQLFEAGFNRLSFGLQAVQPHLLKRLGRIHTFGDFTESVNRARAAGFTSINADIMFGLPEQTLADVEETVNRLLQLPIDHVSFYSLSLEDGTPLKSVCESSPGLLPDDETERQQYHRIIQLLESAGFIHYEISNSARPGRACRHNLVYWQARSYYGFGASAHSFTQGIRRANTVDLTGYLSAWQPGSTRPVRSRSACTELETVDRNSAMKEMLLLGLRLLDGVSAEAFSSRFGCSMTENFGSEIKRLVKRGLLSSDQEGIRLTTSGLDLANQVFMEFVDRKSVV